MSKQRGVVEQLGLALNALRLEVPAEVMDDVDLRFRAVITKLEALEQTERYYVELICAVATKNEDETRHQTALRYIRERETHRSGPPAAAAERSE